VRSAVPIELWQNEVEIGLDGIIKAPSGKMKFEISHQYPHSQTACGAEMRADGILSPLHLFGTTQKHPKRSETSLHSTNERYH
jgi:hypothetical protein